MVVVILQMLLVLLVLVLLVLVLLVLVVQLGPLMLALLPFAGRWLGACTQQNADCTSLGRARGLGRRCLRA